MKRNYLGHAYFFPLMLWSELATKALEMTLASAQVIGFRTGRLALAGATPSTHSEPHENRALVSPPQPPTR